MSEKRTLYVDDYQTYQEIRRNVWYCRWCDHTHPREDGPDEVACNNCNRYPMEPAYVSWNETTPRPDPLEQLLVSE